MVVFSLKQVRGQLLMMKRREFITLVGGVAASSVSARAQQARKLPTIGFLGSATPSTQRDGVSAFVQRLKELGWIEGSTVAIVYRWAEGRIDRGAELLAEFVRLKVDLIVMPGGANALAAKQATSVIPIVFAGAGDPVGMGLVASLAQPGGNLTGLSMQSADLAGKRLELLREIVPGLRHLAIMANLGVAGTALEIHEARIAATKLGLEVVTLEIKRSEDIGPAFDTLKGRADALYVGADPLAFTNRLRINTLALGARLPTTYNFREYVEAAGLMSYGANFPDLFRRAGDYVDKICVGRSQPTCLSSSRPSSI